MQEIIYTKGYEALKEELRAELSKSVESFVRIGYLLKVARDTNVLSESPYSNMEEFAYAEFKIDKGTASKFMNINDRFAEDGYSDRLKTEYAGIGWSKLSIMLQLPDSINEEITGNFSKSEIQTIQEEIKEEARTTPVETLLEGETSTTAAAEDILDKTILQLGESNPEIYTSVHAIVKEGYTYNIEDIKSILAPSGENMYSIRIRGVGRILLSVKDYEETVALVNERSGEKETRSWEDVARSWLKIIDIDSKPEENWESTYGQTFPKTEEVAPVQPKKEAKVKKVNETPKKVIETKKNDAKSEKSVQKTQESVEKTPEQETLHAVEPSIPAPDPIEQDPEDQEPAEEQTEEQQAENLPGQQDLETDYKEVVPGNAINTLCEPDSDDEKQQESEEKEFLTMEQRMILSLVDQLSYDAKRRNWEVLKEHVTRLYEYINQAGGDE